MLVSQKFAELSEPYCNQGLRFNITDYYHSMMLRGDNPLGEKDVSYGNILDYWEAYDIDNDAVDDRDETYFDPSPYNIG